MCCSMEMEDIMDHTFNVFVRRRRKRQAGETEDEEEGSRDNEEESDVQHLSHMIQVYSRSSPKYFFLAHVGIRIP